jgi:hypothetical protein
MKRLGGLVRLILKAAAVPLLLVFLLCMGGQSVGRATGLTMRNYIPPNLNPSAEIVCIVVQENQASDLFQLPA